LDNTRLKALTRTICLGDFHVAWSFFIQQFVLSVYELHRNFFFPQPTVKYHLSYSNLDSILHKFGGPSLHNIRHKFLPKQYVREILHGMLVFRFGYLFFLYINCLKKTPFFLSQPFKHHSSDSNTDSILNKFGGPYLHNISLKALITLAICP
jgi:hypothetical protein